ncbi:MAG: sorbosone dehydrogenase family protein [Gemmatimonadetes bacterium]|nr:sorbosone dehydrogenase family protein [Gemmatimonadota bacterium]
MPRRFALSLSGAMLAVGATLSALPLRPAAAQEVFRTAEHDYRLRTVVEGLVNPWGLAFLPNGDLLVTERPGRLRIVRQGKLLPTPVPGVPAVLVRGQGGLLDVAVHPDFATNKLVYLTFSKPTGERENGTTAVVRGTLVNDQLTNVQEIFVAKTRGAPGHFGSRLAFDGKGHLFVSVGDRQVPPTGNLAAHPAQDLSNHHGKILRLLEDGRVPPDNPFVGKEGALPEIWSYGHRNPQGLLIHPETGALWETEHGPQGGDELNLVKPGANYGWPVIGFGVNYTTGSAIHGGTFKEGMEQPKLVWVPSIATAGMMLYTGTAFPRWKGNVFVGGMAGEQLARIALTGDKAELAEVLVRRKGRIRDVQQGPDGFIYLAIDDRASQPSAIIRLEPVARK